METREIKFQRNIAVRKGDHIKVLFGYDNIEPIEAVKIENITAGELFTRHVPSLTQGTGPRNLEIEGIVISSEHYDDSTRIVIDIGNKEEVEEEVLTPRFQKGSNRR